MKQTVLSLLLLVLYAMAVPAQQNAPLLTPWGENLDPENVHPEYPRPQMKRNAWLNLNGKWSYAITDKDATQPKQFDGEILVPFPIESTLSGVGKLVGDSCALWYSRKFSVPAAWKGKDIMLNFGGVDWECELWVNNKYIGKHTGAYTPFNFNITKALKKRGENSIVLRVYDPTDKGPQPRGKQVTKPKGIWYTPVTGIWQTVWLEPVSAKHIAGLKITPDVDTNILKVNVSGNPETEIEVKVTDKDIVVASGSGRPNADISISMPADVKLWSPSSPNLYGLEVTMTDKGKVVDRVNSYAAMRKVSAAPDASGVMRLMLNNRQIYHFGPLDQGWWPDGLYTAPSHDAMVYDIDKTKDFGFNMIRKHIKVEPATWYAHCDSVGIIVWQDMPSGDRTDQWQRLDWYRGDEEGRSPESDAIYRKEWREIMEHLHNFPCINVWVPFNEAWGQYNTVEIADWTKQFDPSRLVNSASGGNFFHCGDIVDMHHYPEPKIVVTDTSRVNVLGEYGGIGYAAPGHLWSPNRNWGYVKYNSPDEVSDQYLKYIAMLAEQSGQIYAGAVYTQTTDVENEVNGLITYDRKLIKIDEKHIGDANRRLVRAFSEIDPADFDTVCEGKKVALYSLKNGAIEANVTNFGGRVVTLSVPDKDGKPRDVVLGHDNIRDYMEIDGNFGALIGPYGNRINEGKFSLDGKEYQLPRNNYGHCLHGGPTGFHNRPWNVLAVNDTTITLGLHLPDGLDGFPGERDIEVTYILGADTTLRIDYKATTDRPTIMNLTNHSYFNLSGNPSADILDHSVTFRASAYTPIDSTFMTTGEICPVAGTPFDFLTSRTVGERIGQADPQLTNGLGYDHNMVLDNPGDNSIPAATVRCPSSGISMEVYTDQPGIQFYTGNFLDGKVPGKGFVRYPHRSAIVLETQHYPDSPNKIRWPSVRLNPGETYATSTVYKFISE